MRFELIRFVNFVKDFEPKWGVRGSVPLERLRDETSRNPQQGSAQEDGGPQAHGELWKWRHADEGILL